MRERLNRFIDLFESKFNIIIDITALIGSLFCIFLSIFVFIGSFFSSPNEFFPYEIIILPGVLGFFALIMLFALRITRHLTKE